MNVRRSQCHCGRKWGGAKGRWTWRITVMMIMIMRGIGLLLEHWINWRSISDGWKNTRWTVGHRRRWMMWTVASEISPNRYSRRRKSVESFAVFSLPRRNWGTDSFKDVIRACDLPLVSLFLFRWLDAFFPYAEARARAERRKNHSSLILSFFFFLTHRLTSYRAIFFAFSLSFSLAFFPATQVPHEASSSAQRSTDRRNPLNAGKEKRKRIARRLAS